MKPLAFLLALMLPFAASAKSLGSPYNSEQYEIDGMKLVQDADDKDTFYIVPMDYHLKSGWDLSNQNRLFLSGLTNTVENGFSVYTLTMTTKPVGESKRELIQAKLQSSHRNARVNGAVPICGIKLAMFDYDIRRDDSVRPDPKQPTIQYSLNSTEADSCRTPNIKTTEFTIEYRVSVEAEPGVAIRLMSNQGMIFPPVTYVHPLKYKDKVKVTIDVENNVDQLKAAGQAAGTIKFFSFDVGGAYSKLTNNLRINASIESDCQNMPACQGYIDQAKEILAKTFYEFTPLVEKGDTNPIVLDSDKSAGAGVFKASFKADYQKYLRNGKFEVDYSNMNYSTAYSQLQVIASKVTPDSFSSEVQGMEKFKKYVEEHKGGKL